MKEITIDRTEQWEYTASGYGMAATACSEEIAELNLLRKVVDKLEDEISTLELDAYDRSIEAMGEDA